VALLALLTLAATGWSAPMKWTLGGYLQARFTEDFGSIDYPAAADNPSTFTALRPSILLRAFDDEHLFLQLFLQAPRGSSSPEFMHAFAEYRAAPYAARAGLFPAPFGYENPLSSAGLITTERSQASQELIGALANDRGIYVHYMPGPEGKFNAALALVNGQPYNVSHDTNNAKNLVARVGYYLPGGEVGVSAISGKGREAIDPGTFNRFAVDLVWAKAPFTIIGEYIAGTTGTPIELVEVKTDARGGYLTFAYRAPDTPWMPYLRLDVLDRDTDAAGDYFNRITGGVSYYLNANSKLQAELESINDQRNPDLEGRFTLQYQITF